MFKNKFFLVNFEYMMAFKTSSGNVEINRESSHRVNNPNITLDKSSVVENYRIKNPGLEKLPLILRIEGLFVF